MLSHLPFSLNLTFDDMFRDDVSMDLFIKTISGQTEPARPTQFLIDGSHQWKFVLTTVLIQEIVLQPVLIQKKTYSTENWEYEIVTNCLELRI
jgi:hypothetical protein